MNDEQKELIHDYMKLTSRINKREYQLDHAQVEFYNSNFYGRTQFDTVDGVKFKGFNVESKVIGYIDYVNKIKKNISKMERKQYHFNNYLKTLSNDRLQSLNRRYLIRGNDIESIPFIGSDLNVIDEILEIEEAVYFEFGGIAHAQLEFKMLKVESIEFRADTVENSFEAMTELLGV